MNRKRTYLPGEICTISGRYGIVDANGKPTGAERGVNAGEPFPPAGRKAQRYVLVDPTKTGKEIEMKPAKSTEITRKPATARVDGDPSITDPGDNILKWTTTIAVIKSVLSIGIGVYFLYMGLKFLSGLISVTLDMKLFDMIKPTMMTIREVFGLSDVNAQIASGLVTLISLLAILVLVVSPGLLLVIGYKLLTEEIFEKEMDKTGSLILRLRSGLGKVKPIEEMINSIFARSRSAWDLQLWTSRITFFIGILILAVAVLQLVVPDLFGKGVDKAVFFGAGVGASLLSMVISYVLNPAKELQSTIVQNADIELATVNYVKQAELIDGWMTRALLSLGKDNDWSPENEVLTSIKTNTDILKKALEDSVKTIDATKTAVPAAVPPK